MDKGKVVFDATNGSGEGSEQAVAENKVENNQIDREVPSVSQAHNEPELIHKQVDIAASSSSVRYKIRNFPLAKGESKKESESPLSKDIHLMLEKYVEELKSPKEAITPIHVDELASRVARFYETVRKVVDWKEDNVLRRSAIVRILKRRIFTKVSGLSVNRKINPDDLAGVVTRELIRGGHLPNNEVPQESIPVVSQSLEKYIYFLGQVSLSSTRVENIKKQVNFTTFVIEIAAAEIEEILANPVKEYVLIDTMTDIMEDRINISPQDSLSDEEKRKQVYIATCRTLFDLDNAFILYRLLSFEYPDWKNPNSEVLGQRFQEVIKFWQDSKETLYHPQSRDFKRMCEQVVTIFTLLSDFLEQEKNNLSRLQSVIKDEKKLEKEIGELYDKRYQTLKRRLFRLGVFSTLSVFLSNWFTFFVVEVPMAQLFYERFSLFTAFIDFLIPTTVMFLLVIIIRPPAKANRKRVLDAVNNFVYKHGKKRFFEIKVSKKRFSIIGAIMSLLYLFMTWLVFTVTGATFYIAGLPITSVVFDTFTIALTVFAAVIIRNKSKELNVDEKTSFFEFVLDMVSVPIARVGSLLAAKWKEYNIIEILFNYLIETPFAAILNAIEEWSKFIKDRKAELH